jgi:hypothetical protein
MGCPMGGREFISEGEVFDLVHIVPRITCIPSPRKNESPIYDLSFDCYSKIKAWSTLLCCTELDVITNSIETKPIEKKTHFHINPYFPFMCNFLPLILFLYNLIVPIVIKRLVRDVPDKHLYIYIDCWQ